VVTLVSVRGATVADAERVALLHADSWRRHYRGAYADEFLDGAELKGNRRSVWSARLAVSGGTATFLAEDANGLAGFVHVVLDESPEWGSLVDNLHVRNGLRGTGIGTRLLTAAARTVVAKSSTRSMYLWVLEQNLSAQAFYRARGGAQVERVVCRPPNIPVAGNPYKLRVSWTDVTALTGSPGQATRPRGKSAESRRTT
jgi:ribosomal protein S18 acetylase RimI-like enzyme